MTYAEQSAASGKRDDEHMIYEMFHLSQYSDGSVLNCRTMKTWTAYEIANGVPKPGGRDEQKMMTDATKQAVWQDLKRNAKAALKNGTTKNIGPRA
jgi:hypothetical protein